MFRSIDRSTKYKTYNELEQTCQIQIRWGRLGNASLDTPSPYFADTAIDVWWSLAWLSVWIWSTVVGILLRFPVSLTQQRGNSSNFNRNSVLTFRNKK